MDMSEIAKQIIQSIKSYVDEKIVSFNDQVKNLQELVESFPIAEKGDPGKDADPEAIKLAVGEAIEALTPPEKGDPGKDADPELIKELVNEAVEKAVEELAKQIPEAEKGQDGRDALDLEILSHIDESKSYPRGRFAIHKGGLWRSFEKTNGMRGWETVVNGIADISIEYDGERALSIKTEKSCGEIVEKDFVIPALIYRGVYKDGEKYAKGDTCTYGGSLYTCTSETSDRPGSVSDNWRLSVKHGRPGKDKK